MAVDIANQKLSISIFGIFPGSVSTDLNGHRQGAYMKNASDGAKEIVNIILDDKPHNSDIIGPKGQILSKIP